MPQHRHSTVVRSALLAALLAAAAGAHAQSSVAVYGLIDLSAGRFQAPGGAADKAVEAGKMTTSYLGFRGSEDLGGGGSSLIDEKKRIRIDWGDICATSVSSCGASSGRIGRSRRVSPFGMGKGCSSRRG